MFRLVRPVLAVACLAVFAFGLTAAADAHPVKLEKGDRVVFLGDSITAAGVGPKGFVTLIKNDLAEKHKDLGIEVVGAGVSGNKVPDLQKRLEKDVLSKKPTIVVIYIGINDVWHGEKDPAKGTSKENYEAGLRDVIKRCQEAGARVALCTPSVIGEKNDGSNTNDAKLDEYAEISRTVAKDLKVPVCDLRKEFQAYEKDHNPDNKDHGVLTGDRVHLNDAGNQFVADALLKTLGA
jgi:isoamyl acetate esterase